MSIVIPPGFGSAAVVMEGGVGTSPFITTLGVDLSPAGGDYVGVANRVMSAYDAAFGESMSPDLTITKVILSIGQDGGDAPTVESDLNAREGGGSGDFASLNSALLLNKRTAVLGRKGRGRMFIPGVIKENMVDISGRLGQTTIDAFNGVAVGFLELLDSDEPGDVGVATTAWLLHSDTDEPPSPLTALTAGPVVGTLRRRIK